MNERADQVVRQMYAAFAERDESRLRELLAPDVEWNQCAGFPGGGRHRGVDAVLSSVFGKNDDNWSGFAVEVTDYVTEGERVVVLGCYSGDHRATGVAMRADFAHVYAVRDGRVDRFDQIADTWPMVEAGQS